MPRRRVSNDASGPAAPANSRAIRHQVSGVCTRRAPSRGRALAPAARLAVAQHFDALARTRHLRQRSDGIDRVEKGGFAAGQLGRQAQLDRAAVAQAGGDQQPLGQQPGSAIENGGRAARARVEAGRVDHQHRRPVAAQELAPGDMDGLAPGPAFGEPRLLHALQALQRPQRLRLGETRQCIRERRCGRNGTGQGSRVGVQPGRQQLEFGSWPPP